jgi:hypothetical protein
LISGEKEILKLKDIPLLNTFKDETATEFSLFDDGTLANLKSL